MMKPIACILALALMAAGLASTTAAEMRIAGTIVIGEMQFEGSDGLVEFIEQNGYDCPHLTSILLGGETRHTRVCCADACYVIDGDSEPTVSPE